MNCRAAKEWARLRRDEQNPASEAAFRAHVRGCDRCAAYGRDFDELGILLASQSEAEPSAAFDWMLRLRLAKIDRGDERARPPLFEVVERRRIGPRLEFWGSAAAAAVIVVAVGLSALRPASDVGRAPLAQRPLSTGFESDAGSQIRRVSSAPVGPQQPIPYASFFLAAPAPAASSGTDSLPATPAR